MKVAIVHEWLTTYGGSETFVELWLRMYPQADIFTLVYDKKGMKGHFEGVKIYTSKLQKLPFATKIYTKLLKFMPRAFESFDLTGYDLVLCSSSSCAKGVIVPPHVPQIAYVHSPMRYAWDLFFDYKKRSGKLTGFFMDRWMTQIRMWDWISAQRPDALVANSKYIARRIKKFWNRDANVIYSPVNVRRFYPDFTKQKEDFYVAFSRFVSYKRMDLAISACKELGRKLFVIGGGPEEKNLRELAKNCENIVFLGKAPDEILRDHLQRAKAMIFCAEEDFGLAPLEAMACSCPVIAFGRGGACETVMEGKTGTFFEKQETESLKEAILRFEENSAKGIYKAEEIAEYAKTFSEERFRKEFFQIVEETREKIKIK